MQDDYKIKLIELLEHAIKDDNPISALCLLNEEVDRDSTFRTSYIYQKYIHIAINMCRFDKINLLSNDAI